MGVAAEAGSVNDMARHVAQKTPKPSDPAAGYGLVKLKPKGKPRRLAEFDAARMLKRKIGRNEE